MGVSGKVDFPVYMRTRHESWLDDVSWIIDEYITFAGSAVATETSPYEGEVAYDPSVALAAVQARYDTFDAIVQALNHDSNWEADVNTARAKIDDGTTFPSIASTVSSIVTSSIGHVGSAVADAIDDVRVNSTNVISDADAAASADVSSIVTSAASKAVSNLTTLVTQGESDLPSVITTAFNAAVSAATSALSSDAVDDAVDAFEEDAKPSYLRAMNRFSGGMADINAVHSSAFVIGAALIEKDFVNQVQRHRSELEMSTYNKGLDLYMGAFSAALSQYLRNYAEELARYIGLYASNYSGNVQLARDMFDSQIGSFNSSYGSYLPAQMQKERARDTMLIGGVSTLTASKKANVGLEREAALLLNDVKKVGIVAEQEQTDRNLELDILDAKWSFEIFEHGCNVMSSIIGAPTVPRGLSKTQSALSGMLGGAALMAGKGAVFGIPGAAIGAGLGLAMGLFD